MCDTRICNPHARPIPLQLLRGPPPSRCCIRRAKGAYLQYKGRNRKLYRPSNSALAYIVKGKKISLACKWGSWPRNQMLGTAGVKKKVKANMWKLVAAVTERDGPLKSHLVWLPYFRRLILLSPKSLLVPRKSWRPDERESGRAQ